VLLCHTQLAQCYDRRIECCKLVILNPGEIQMVLTVASITPLVAIHRRHFDPDPSPDWETKSLPSNLIVVGMVGSTASTIHTSSGPVLAFRSLCGRIFANARIKGPTGKNHVLAVELLDLTFASRNSR